jgi:hypothetical protein
LVHLNQGKNNAGSPCGDPGFRLVPPQPGFYRLDSPKQIGFYPIHLRGEALSFFASIEHDLVIDLSRSQLLKFPHRLSHIALPSACLVLGNARGALSG